MRQLSRPVRRALLVLHVTVSVGWLGLTLALLTLAVTGAADGSAATDRVAYRAMEILGDRLITPVAVTTLATGLVLSLGTPWGLARHRWVYTKFWLTLPAAIASVFAFRAGIDAAAAEAAAGHPVNGADLVIPPSVSLAAYVFVTAISVLKPWGLTRRGRRLRAAGPARRPGTGRKPVAAAAPDRPS